MRHQHQRVDAEAEEAMRTEFAILIGAGVFALVTGLSSTPSDAASRHHYKHARSHHVAQPPVSAAASSDLSLVGNNPGKRYDTRHAPAGAATSSTLMESGNNPGKRYTARQPSAGSATEPTLMTNGNNPARRAKATTTGSAR
jgi:hypothetical protein